MPDPVVITSAQTSFVGRQSTVETGVAVTERVPLKVGRTAHNDAYLATKAAKSGHLL